MTKTLFIGSSLTTAFYDWFKETQDREADFAMGHGALWLPDRLPSSTAFHHSGSLFTFQQRIEVLSEAGEVLKQTFFSTVEDADEKGALHIDLANYPRMVFTVPMLFWDVSFGHLHRNGYGLLTPATQKLFEEAELPHTLSEETFKAIHRARFGHAYAFLEAARSACPDMEIFIAPAVLPPAERKNFPLLWRQLHQHEMRLIFASLKDLYGAIAMGQPNETLTQDLITLPEFMADEHHHYNARFVQKLSETYAF